MDSCENVVTEDVESGQKDWDWCQKFVDSCQKGVPKGVEKKCQRCVESFWKG